MDWDTEIKEWIGNLEDLATEGDYEDAHKEADRILCVILEKLGYEEVVEAWKKVGKWYA